MWPRPSVRSRAGPRDAGSIHVLDTGEELSLVPEEWLGGIIATGVDFARLWMHAEHLADQLDGTDEGVGPEPLGLRRQRGTPLGGRVDEAGDVQRIKKHRINNY